MAAITSVNLTLQTRDWETLVGVISNSNDPDIQDLQFSLQTYYKAQATKPQGTDAIAIATTEETVIKLSTFLYGNTVYNVTKDSGTSPFARIMTAIRSANNIADNYISNQLAINDNNYNLVSTNVRKNGRRVILLKQYDNN